MTVAIVCDDDGSASFAARLSKFDDVTVATVCWPGDMVRAAGVARSIGAVACTEVAQLLQTPGLQLVIDVTGDAAIGQALESFTPHGVEVVSGGAARLLWRTLAALGQGEEQERVFRELQQAYERIRIDERRLSRSKEALERANRELEERLAEGFFTHEFFKALTRFTSVDDVCSLVVDGCNGILGAEISCVYLFEREDWTLRLRASQGRLERELAPVLSISETIVGEAFRDGPIQEQAVAPGSVKAGWVTHGPAPASHAAIPLKNGERTMGVLVVASSSHRELSDREMERLQALANQSSLALQNALLHEELERLSVTDRLTGLYNHGYFRQRLEEECTRSARFGHDLSLIMLDIDDFKEFNDSYGHPRGDELLSSVSAIIRDRLREVDVAARYGGEEFAIVLPATDTEGALAVAERIRQGIEQSGFFGHGGEPVTKTVSIGVASFPGDADTAMGLLEAADAAMYAAKRAGKNRVEATVS